MSTNTSSTRTTALALMAGAVFCAAAGCVQSPVEQLRAVGRSHTLHPPLIQQDEIKGRYVPLDLTYRNATAQLSSYSCLYIGVPVYACEIPEKLDAEDQAKLLRHLQHRLYVHMVGQGCFDLVTKNPKLVEVLSNRYKVCRLDSAITELEPGDGLLRYLIGFDLGGVHVQQEGRLVDAESGDVLIEYADRRIEGGAPRFGFSFAAFDAPMLMRKAAGIQALAVAQYLRYHKGPLVPAPTASAASQTEQLHDIRF